MTLAKSLLWAVLASSVNGRSGTDDTMTKVPIKLSYEISSKPTGNPSCLHRFLQFIKLLLILLIKQIALETDLPTVVGPAHRVTAREVLAGGAGPWLPVLT